MLYFIYYWFFWEYKFIYSLFCYSNPSLVYTINSLGSLLYLFVIAPIGMNLSFCLLRTSTCADKHSWWKTKKHAKISHCNQYYKLTCPLNDFSNHTTVFPSIEPFNLLSCSTLVHQPFSQLMSIFLFHWEGGKETQKNQKQFKQNPTSSHSMLTQLLVSSPIKPPFPLLDELRIHTPL